MSHQIPADSEVSHQNRATPPQIKVSHLSPDPPIALSSHSQQAGAKGGGSRRAGGGYRGTFGFRRRIALQGGVAATVKPAALLCATKIRGCQASQRQGLTSEVRILLGRSGELLEKFWKLLLGISALAKSQGKCGEPGSFRKSATRQDCLRFFRAHTKEERKN